MPERDPAEHLDALIDELLRGAGPSSDDAAAFVDLVAVAKGLRGLPSEDFRARLGAELETTVAPSRPRANGSRRFSGQILQPGADEYDQARRVHNGRVNRRPALIAQCHSTADIVDAVNLARTLRLEVAIRGGGHDVGGLGTIDGGLLIDLSPMSGVRVDPAARTARAQGGATWADYDRETQAHGLASTGGVVSSVGVAGLTLGGGVGWLMGRHGLAIDNLLSVELVTADGRVLTASEREHPDLFWALRGGGGNFGVAASLEYRVHPLGPEITGGFVGHPLSRSRDVLRFYRDVTAAAPDELTAFAGLLPPPGAANGTLAWILACHSGALASGEAAVAPIKVFGRPVIETFQPMPYRRMNSMLDAMYPRRALQYWKSSFLAALSDEAIETVVDCYARCPSPTSQVLIEHMHGAAVRVGPTDTAFPHRTAGYNLLILGQWIDPAEGGRCVSWVQETFAAMRPFLRPGRYVNYLDDDEDGDPVAEAYEPNYARLREVKARYDPDNRFHVNQNIRPQTTGS